MWTESYTPTNHKGNSILIESMMKNSNRRSMLLTKRLWKCFFLNYKWRKKRSLRRKATEIEGLLTLKSQWTIENSTRSWIWKLLRKNLIVTTLQRHPAEKSKRKNPDRDSLIEKKSTKDPKAWCLRLQRLLFLRRTMMWWLRIEEPEEEARQFQGAGTDDSISQWYNWYKIYECMQNIIDITISGPVFWVPSLKRFRRLGVLAPTLANSPQPHYSF